MTAFRNVPEKKFRLHDGSFGTEYEAVAEAIRSWEQKRQEAEDALEQLRNRLNSADGHP